MKKMNFVHDSRLYDFTRVILASKDGTKFLKANFLHGGCLGSIESVYKNPRKSPGANLRKTTFSKWPPKFCRKWRNLSCKVRMLSIYGKLCINSIQKDNLRYLMCLSEIFNADLTEFGRPLPNKAKYGITSSFFTLWSWMKCLHVGFQGQQTQLWG